MNRREFLKMLGAAVLTPLLPKVKAPVKENDYWTCVGTTDGPSISSRTEDEERIKDFLMSCECSESEEWSVHPKCDWDSVYLPWNTEEVVYDFEIVDDDVWYTCDDPPCWTLTDEPLEDKWIYSEVVDAPVRGDRVYIMVGDEWVPIEPPLYATLDPTNGIWWNELPIEAHWEFDPSPSLLRDVEIRFFGDDK